MPVVLIVDANEDQKMLYATLFKRRAFGVLYIDSIEDAYSMPALATDLVFYIWGKGPLDEMSLRRLRANYPKVPIVVASAHAYSKDRVDALMVGADEFLTIPFTVEHFDEVLNVWVRESRSA